LVFVDPQVVAILAAGHELPFKVEPAKLDLPELQGEPEEISIQKCRIAAKQVCTDIWCRRTAAAAAAAVAAAAKIIRCSTPARNAQHSVLLIQLRPPRLRAVVASHTVEDSRAQDTQGRAQGREVSCSTSEAT
jgi:hypothetical protein